MPDMRDSIRNRVRAVSVALVAVAGLAGVATAQDRHDNQKRDATQQRAPEQRPRPPEAGSRPPELRPHASQASPQVRPPGPPARPAQASPNPRPPVVGARPPEAHARPPEVHTRPPEAHARPPEARPRPPDLRLDQRYRHDHYYPPRGHVVPVLPGGSIGITFGPGSYFFHGGVWFRPWTGRFVVVVPPQGIVVPLLPPAYATLWIGGVPYYYANGVYYAPMPGQGYVVVAPPPGAEAIQTVPQVVVPPAPPEPVMYPRNGQSAEQIEADRQECNRWATTQASATPDATVYQRAFAACMDARGYTVR